LAPASRNLGARPNGAPVLPMRRWHGRGKDV